MADKKKRLGKGLGSLLSSTRLSDLDAAVSGDNTSTHGVLPEATPDREFVKSIALEQIQKNPYQPRRNWDERKLSELSSSIKANGLIQPIVVRPMGAGYQLIAGERRLKAMQLAGLSQIPALVRDAQEEQVLEWALVENIHRDDLNAMERARAYQLYVDNFSLTRQEIADRLGEDRSTIANYMRLLELPSEIQQMVVDDQISMGHARALLGITPANKQRQLAEEVVRNNLSVREIEYRIRNFPSKSASTNKEVPLNPNLAELEQKLTQSLGTKVIIKTVGRKGKRGRIIIEFYSLDDFDRITEKINS